MPQYAPKLLSDASIPSWFAQDLLQRLSPGSKYREVWPSLFVAPAGLRSALHIDAFGSNFWMALFAGVKRWTFYAAEDTTLLRPDYTVGLDPVFPSDAEEESTAVPRHVVDLQAGDVLFVPAGCAHTVENLSDTIAVWGC